MKTVEGWDVKNIHNTHVVSVKEGRALRAKALAEDKRLIRVFSWYKPRVNPETYTDEEREFMNS